MRERYIPAGPCPPLRGAETLPGQLQKSKHRREGKHIYLQIPLCS